MHLGRTLFVTRPKRAVFLIVAVGLPVAVTGFVLRHQAAAARPRPGPAVVLAALPSIGTVYWRYNCLSRGPIRYSLGIHIWRGTATSEVRFRAGRLALQRELQPGDPTSWFPYSANQTQWLAAASGGEEGTVVGAIRIDYSYPSREYHCFPSAPPRLTVPFSPRRYYDSRDFLRQFTR